MKNIITDPEKRATATSVLYLDFCQSGHQILEPNPPVDVQSPPRDLKYKCRCVSVLFLHVENEARVKLSYVQLLWEHHAAKPGF